ncbi:MAG TPA: hypothetical protein ENN41_04600 [Sediminispirochaeta sp.]|nr:hypothetical protein [Sediminispirochaeta sp.]
MISIVCDACKKAIPGPEKLTGVKYVLDKAICKSCAKELDRQLAEEMGKRDKYKLSAYRNLYVKTLYKMCS